MMLRCCRQLVPLVLLTVTVAWCFELVPPSPREQAKYWLDLGVQHAERQEYDAAIEALKKAIFLDPRLQSAYYNLGLIYYQAGKPAQAVGYYGEALKLDPGDVQAQRGLGLAYAAQNKWQRAAAVFAELVRTTPDDPAAALQLGQAYLRLNQANKAIPPLEKATRLSPTDPLGHVYLATALALAGQVAEAERHLLKAQDLKPDSDQIKLELLNLYLASGRLLSAEPLALELVAKHPDDKLLLSAQVEIYEGLGLMREKHHAQEALLAQLPRRQSLAMRAQLAEEYLATAYYDEALVHLEIIYKARPTDPGIAATLARCYLKLGETQPAFTLLEKGVKLSPQNPELATMLGDLYVGRRQLGDALAAYEQALAADRDHLPALQAACQIGTRLGLTTRTLGWLRRLLALTPQDWPARMMLTEHLAAVRRSGPAMYQFSEILARSGDEEMIEAAQLYLLRLAQQTGNNAYEEFLRRQPRRHATAGPAGLVREYSEEQVTKQRIEALLAENPDSLPAKALLAEFYLQSGESERAEPVLREILAAQPKHAEANYLMARVRQEQQVYVEAITYLQQSIRAQPAIPAPYEALLACAEAADSLESAGDFLTGVLADLVRAPDSGEPAIQLLVSYLARIHEHSAGQEQAIAELTPLSDAFPNSAELALAAARLLASVNQPRAAGKYYERAARSPKYGHVLAEAALLQLPGHPQAALGAANTYLGRVVRDDEALALIIELQARAEEPTAAQKDAVGRLLSSRPRSAEYQIAKVDLWQQAGRMVEAEAHLRAAVLANPDNAPLRTALAYALWLRGQPADALGQLGQLPAEVFDDPGLRTLKATILADGGSAELAISELGEALITEPEHPQAALLRAKLLKEAREYQEALWEICQTLIHHPESEAVRSQAAEMVKPGNLPLDMVLTALSQAYAVSHRPEVIRKLVLQFGESSDQIAVEQWLANHPRRLGEDG